MSCIVVHIRALKSNDTFLISPVAGAQQQCLVPLHDRRPSRACHVCYPVHVELRKSLQFGAPTPSGTHGSHVQLPGFEATPSFRSDLTRTYTYFATTVGVVQLTFLTTISMWRLDVLIIRHFWVRNWNLELEYIPLIFGLTDREIN